MLCKVLLGCLAATGAAQGQPANPADSRPSALPAAPPDAGEPMPLPAPRAFPGRLEALPFQGLGTAPAVDPNLTKKYGKYVQEFKDAQLTLDLISGRTRLMLLNVNPTRIQVADETVASYTVLSPKQISLMGHAPGVTVLTLWFIDPNTRQEEILTYHVRVVPDPEAKVRLEAVYKALAEEVNRAFPNSVITLQLVGDKLVVGGHAKDAAEAAKILQVIRANAPVPPRAAIPEVARIPVDPARAIVPAGANTAPPLEAYELSATGSYLVNLLQINGEQQVMLKVMVAEVNRAAARSIGVNFNLQNAHGAIANSTGAIASGGLAFGNLIGAGNNPNFGTAVGVAGGNGGFNNIPVAADNGQIQLAVSALKVLQYARSLAEPTLVALNGQTADFRAGGQFPVPVVTGNTQFGLQGVTFVPYGVQVKFTPYITDRDRVRLVIDAEISTRDLASGQVNFGGASVPNLNTRSFHTTVELREGQTLAVAGLIQNNIGADGRRIPFIGELPLISRLLGFDRTTSGEQEVVMLITPELVHPLDPNEAHIPLPGADLFEPGDCEFYLSGRLESNYPADYRTAVRTDYHRLKMPRQLESLYLSGPHGHDGEVIPPPPPIGAPLPPPVGIKPDARSVPRAPGTPLPPPRPVDPAIR